MNNKNEYENEYENASANFVNKKTDLKIDPLPNELKNYNFGRIIADSATVNYPD